MKTLVIYIPGDPILVKSVEEVFSAQDIDYQLERFGSLSWYHRTDWMVLTATMDPDNEDFIYASLRTTDALFRYYCIGELDIFDNVDTTTVAIVRQYAKEG